MFRNSGIEYSDAGESPKGKNKTFTTGRNFEIENDHFVGCSNIIPVDGKGRGVASEFCGAT